MFQQVYFHKTSRSSEWMLGRVIGRVRTLLLDGVRVPGVPPALATLATEGDADLKEYLALDDVSLWTAIDHWRASSDPMLSDLARRLHARRLFKSYELYGPQCEPERRERLLEVARDLARTNGFDPDVYVGLDVARDVPFGSDGESLSVIFADHPARLPHEVSFLLGRLYGQEMARMRLFFPEELRQDLLARIEA
jgi:HD superfamily phosphohydrolase